MKIHKELAECLGLWLAEGNNKCHNEITFTNQNFELILYFDKTLRSLFSDKRIRLYVYSASNQEINLNKNLFNDIKYYSDERARKPYFIWRLASVAVMIKWRELLNKAVSERSYYAAIIRGFFAGEGSVKIGSHNSRILRIAQKEQKAWINKMLNSLSLTYKFRSSDKTYEFSGKWNWDIFAQYKLADLHDAKKQKFWKLYHNYKETHYPTKYLYNNLLSDLCEPTTAASLAVKYNRKQSRLSEVLSLLKANGKAKDFRIRSTNYWISSGSNKIIISKIKNKYLELLRKNPRKTAELAKFCSRCFRSTAKRLLELEKLGLVKRNKLNKWEIVQSENEVIAL